MSEPITVIGITGVARSGKDTIAKLLCARHGFTRIALADGLRSAFGDLDGLTWDLRKELETFGISQRTMLQIMGTECRMEIGFPRLWIALLLVKINYLAHHHPVPRTEFVVPDIRFLVEASEFREMIPTRIGGSFDLWKVVRPGSGLDGIEGMHASETELDLIHPDVTIHNGNSIRELEAAVNTYARQLLETR
jgi:hypothetical protein